MEGLSGGAGVKFRSKDEAALAWALENASYAKSGERERAGTIYSQSNGKKGKTFSYNGSFIGRSTEKSDYKEELIPEDATVEGLIHTHPIQNDFSKHEDWDDKKQPLDEDYMNNDEHLYMDFYLVNPLGQLLVRRRAVQMMSNPGRRGKSKSLVDGLKTGNYMFHLPDWEGPDGRPLKPGQVPDLVREQQKKIQQKKQ